MRYHLLMRLFAGSLDLAAAERSFDGRFRRTLWPELAALLASGTARHSRGNVRLTERGYYLWVVMMREFFNGVNNFRAQMRHGIAAELALLPDS
jgi:coproporphyrinogen III oxidase-like Fe-S oxidoreductase